MSTLLEQASLVLIPSGYKEDTVYSVVPSNGSGDMSFTRASDGTRINFDGLVENTPWNFITNSETIGTGSWGYTNYTLSANSTTAPNGTMTADLFTLNNGIVGGAGNAIANGVSQLGQITMSVYFKNNNSTGTFILQDGNSKGITVNVATLSFTNLGSAVGSVENVGNGWYRIITTITETSSYYFYAYQNGMTGDGIKGIYLWGAQVNIGSTAKPYFPTTDRLNVPRLTYQNGGGGCPSLLLEPQRTNLFTYSEDFTIWTKGQFLATLPTVTADYGISPSGVQNADRVQMTRPSGSSYVEITKQSFITVGTVITFSVFIKSLIGATKMTIGALGSTNTINLTNDWVRYTYTMTTTNNPTTFSIGIIGSQADSLTADFLVWGAQVESGAYQSSYIPTVASSATRIADACSKTGISSLIGQTEGVLFAEFIPSKTTDVVNLSANGTFQTDLNISYDANNKRIGINFYVNGTYIIAYFSASNLAPLNTKIKVAVAYKSGDLAIYINGVQSNTSTTTYTIVSPLTRIRFNQNNFTGSDSILYNQVILFPNRLTNSELATLTTI